MCSLVCSQERLELAIPKSFYIKTYGCQMNVYDSQRIAELLSSAGYKSAPSLLEADVIVLNTCYIRKKAEDKLFSYLGKLRILKEKREQDGGETVILVVTGCTAQALGEQIYKRAPYVSIVLGPQAYYKLPSILEKLFAHSCDAVTTCLDLAGASKFCHLPKVRPTASCSAFLSIQEGCDKFCHYCVVPSTRGREFSRPVNDVLEEAVSLVDGGSKEIILLGQNVSSYRGKYADGNPCDLADLLYNLSKISGLMRLRYITSYPSDIGENLIFAHRDIETLMPFLHLPVQSGSNSVLKQMNRRYTKEFYIELVEKLRCVRTDLAFSSDFIVGFPGETDDDFEETCDLIRCMDFVQAYSFKYSPRPGTPAAQRPQIAEVVKHERILHLQQLLSEQQLKFNKSMEGRVIPVLVENSGRHSGQWTGRSPYMQAVNFSSPNRLCGEIVSVRIAEGRINSLSGDPHCF